MSKLFNVKEMCDTSLRRVGAMGPHDSAADPDEFSIAVDALDRLVGEVVATEKPLWLIPRTIDIPIPASTNPLDLIALAGVSIEQNRFEAVAEVTLRGPATVPTNQWVNHPLTRLSRKQYFEDIANFSAGGQPCFIYIDKQEFNPLAYLYPVLSLTGYFLHFTFYENADVLEATGDHSFPRSWQRFLDYQLAFDIGSGPVLMLNGSRLSLYKTEAKEARAHLFARQNRETDTPRKVVFRNF